MAEKDIDGFLHTEYMEIDPLPGTPKDALLPNGKIQVPKREADDYLEFSVESEVGWGGLIARSGIATHFFMKISEDSAPKCLADPIRLRSFPARYAHLYDDCNVDFECLNVLNAHGWVGSDGKISRLALDIVAKNESVCLITKSKLRYNSNWQAFLFEVAACYEALPLSRLWYVANIYSLYYCHYDDLRAGYLWAEYQLRKGAEKHAVRGQKTLAAAAAGGESRGRSRGPRNLEIIERMRPLIAERKLSATRAAQIVFENGLGTSGDANRQLWRRRNQ